MIGSPISTAEAKARSQRATPHARAVVGNERAKSSRHCRSLHECGRESYAGMWVLAKSLQAISSLAGPRRWLLWAWGGGGLLADGARDVRQPPPQPPVVELVEVEVAVERGYLSSIASTTTRAARPEPGRASPDAPRRSTSVRDRAAIAGTSTPEAAGEGGLRPGVRCRARRRPGRGLRISCSRVRHRSQSLRRHRRRSRSPRGGLAIR